MIEVVINEICLKMAYVKLQPHLPGVNEWTLITTAARLI